MSAVHVREGWEGETVVSLELFTFCVCGCHVMGLQEVCTGLLRS